MITMAKNNKQFGGGKRLNRIAVCAMVRNEADIIESFCRHAFLYADVLLITDHMSTDGTWEILQKLKGEGLPLYLWRSYESGKHQAAVMTVLMQRAVKEYGADLIVLSDADEFLVSSRGAAKDVRNRLQSLPLLDRPGSYSLKMITCEFAEPNEDRAAFALSRKINREVSPAGVVKVIACRSAVEDFGLEVVEGNHGLMSGERRRKGMIMMDVPYVPLEPEELCIVHLPGRSEGQFLSKCFCGWLSQVAQNSRFGYFAPQYKEVWEKYLQGKWKMRKMEASYPAKLESYRHECYLKYTKGEVDPLANVMQVAEIFAEDYLREKVKGERPSLSVLLVVDKWEDDAEWVKKTLSALPRQDYPVTQVLVLLWRNELVAVQRALAGICPASTVLFAREAANKLKEVVQGSYVKWLLPGDEMLPGFLARLMLLLQTNPMACVAFCSTEMLVWPEGADVDCWGWNWDLPSHHAPASYWRMIFLQGGVHMPLCLASSVFRLDVMKRVNFLAGGVQAQEIGVFNNISTWVAILEGIQQIEPSDGAVFWLKEVLAKAKILWDEPHKNIYMNDLQFVREKLS